MPVLWVIARHPELGGAVLPALAVASYPGWEADGEPSLDPNVLRNTLELESRAAVQAAAELFETRVQKSTRAASPVSAPAVAPAGAAPKE